MRITWITEDDGPSVVEYGSKYSLKATGSSDNYSYLLYRSGHIHDVVTGPLSPRTVYDYRLGMNSACTFSLKTPPNSLPFKFAVVGAFFPHFFVVFFLLICMKMEAESVC